MFKKRISGLILFFMTLCSFQLTVSAAEALTNDNHIYDTDDYCLRAQDVNIGRKEMLSYATKEELYQTILDTANPVILIRDITKPYVEWECLPRDALTIEFPEFEGKEDGCGYPVTITAPPIQEGVVSRIVFQVYIEEDLPVQVNSVIHFAGCGLEDMILDITDGKILCIEELPVPEKEGYVFSGWYLDEELTIPFLLPGDDKYRTQELKGDLILYPKWCIEKQEPVMAVIHFAECDLEDMEIDITGGMELSIEEMPVPEKKGYEFQGWYLDQGLTKPYFISGDENYSRQKVSGDLTLYPKWRKKSQSAVSTPDVADNKQSEDSQLMKSTELPEYIPAFVEPFITVEEHSKEERETETRVHSKDIPTTEAGEPTTETGEDTKLHSGGENYNNPKGHSSGGQEGGKIVEMILLGIYSVTMGGLGYGIVSDLQVLRWYQRKKALRGAGL